MLITKAPPAAPLVLQEGSGEQMFRTLSPPDQVCMVTVAGSSKLDLTLFEVTATGTIAPGQEGELEIVLLARANEPNLPPMDPGKIYPEWTAIAHTPKEPVGGSGNLAETMWMVQGTRLMYYLASGKLQGEWVSNIADHPTTAVDLSNALTGIQENIDPTMMFAVSAIFTPTVAPIVEPNPALTLASLTLSTSTE